MKGIGPKRMRLLNKLGLYTDADLLAYYPRRYEDRSQIQSMAFLEDGAMATVEVLVRALEERTVKKGLVLLKAHVRDGSGDGSAVWFNQPFLKKQIMPGTRMLLTGKAQCRFGKKEIAVTDFQVMGDETEPLHGARIVPFYPLTEGLSQKFFREILHRLLDRMQTSKEAPGETPEETSEETLYSKAFLNEIGLIRRMDALRWIHFPGNEDDLKQARKRLVFDEFFLIQLALMISRNQTKRENGGIAHAPDGDLIARWMRALPFALTAAQQRVVREIRGDMEAPLSMQRLVQGDVGSGKTAVAAYALLKAAENGRQGALMAPTEILAKQHYETLFKWFAPLGIQLGFVTGALSQGRKRAALEDIASGYSQVVVGTHALFQTQARFKNASLLVIDEQHRFGVRQRALLEDKGLFADVLVMSATPIPRTLALTLYGDLDISLLDELPPGRKPVETLCILDRARDKLRHFMKNKLDKGQQIYVVCPLIEESEVLDLKNAKDIHEDYVRMWPGYAAGLLHGRMKPAEKEAVMEGFSKGEIRMLVTTTVIEVGVNVPKATVMVVESAERFGLAQLHQLRGRVGRGSDQSYCILVTETKNPVALTRLKLMTQINDGFKLAEEDMILRGPGEFFGSRQHGLPEFKLAKLPEDASLLDLARNSAARVLREDPRLSASEHQRLAEEIRHLMDAMVRI
jgi:ATP-dependent DNA helicase RecG